VATIERAAEPTPAPTDDRFEQTWAMPKGIWGQLRTVQNDPIGMRTIAMAFIFFLLGGLDSLFMRIQLGRPENDFVTPERYNELFTMHGSAMMFLFAVPMVEGIAALVLPMLLGSRELPFPRLGAFTFWTFLLGGAFFYSSTLLRAVPNIGWFAYAPLSGPEYSPGLATDFWLLALSVAEIGGIAAAVEIIIAVFKMRAPGMSIGRIPIFGWAMLVTAFMMLFGFTILVIGSYLLEFDRKFGTRFFDPDRGGDPLLWQHLFWIFGHPDVYMSFLPAAGMVSMIVTVFARRPLSGYPLVALAMVATGFLSFGLWVHHMFTAGLPQISLTFFAAASMAIAIPAGIQVVAWLRTIWAGRPVVRTPLLFVLGFIVIFVLGGITGVMVAAVPFDLQVHDSQFIVAHLHYVLVGGVVFPIFAGLYYWLPKYTNRLMDEQLGHLQFWLLFIGTNLCFFPMHISGLLGMPRRVYTYPPGLGWEVHNQLATIGAFIMAAGVVLFFVNLLWSLRGGAEAGNDPWGGDSLEWAASSPPPNYGFRTIPIVRGRHPLWEQASLRDGDERTVALVDRLAEWPDRWRAALATTTLEARPEEVFRVAGESIWPLVASLGVTGIFVAFLFDWLWLIIGSLLVCGVALVGWHWPHRAAEQTDPAAEAEFERRFDIPIRPLGSQIVARWAMALVVVIVATVVGTLVYSYYYLRLGVAAWPPDDIPPPNLLLPAIATALLLLSSGAVQWAVIGARAGRVGRLKLGLAAGAALGAGHAALLAADLLGLPYTWQTNAYGSLVYAITGFAILNAGIAVAMSALVQVWAWQGYVDARRPAAVENLALYWHAGLVAMGVIMVATLALAPYFI
jgi:cytochrome c oxidase subunit I+III